LAWYGKNLNLTQQKHTFTSDKKCTTQKLKPGLVTFYDIWLQKGACLFSKEKIGYVREEVSKEKVKKEG